MEPSRPFDICLDTERKGILVEALDNYINKLEKDQASKIKIDQARFLKEDLEKIRVC